jgi:hypothetical protein
MTFQHFMKMVKPGPKGKNEIASVLLLTCSGLILLYPVIFAHEASFFIKQDNLHQAYPWYNKLASSLHKGYLPVWDANTFGGKSFAGEPQPGIFYPVNIVWCLVFGTENGISTYYLDLLVSLHYIIGLLGMYAFARIFQLSTIGAFAAALVFAFAGPVGARAAGQTCIFYGLTLLPWTLYFIARYYLVRPNRLYLILAGLIGGMQILAGHMQPFFHTMLIGGIMLLFYEYQRRSKRLTFILSTAVNLLIILAVSIIVALPQIYYSAQYLSQCYRTVSYGIFIAPGQKVPLYIYSHWFIISLSNLGNFLAQGYAQPDDDNILYMGILPLLLTIIYLIWPKMARITPDHSILTKILTVVLLIGFLSAMGKLTFFYLVLYSIPMVNQVRQLGRYIIMISFSVSLLTGLAITYINSIKEWLFQKAGGPAVKAFSWLPLMAVGVIFIDLLLNPVGYLPARSIYYPDHFYGRNRIIDSLEKTYGQYRVSFDMTNYGMERRNLGDIYKIQTKWGYGATVNKPYSDFVHFDHRRSSDIDDLLNVRYVITDKNLDSNYIYKDSTLDMKLYERKSWYPRCYWKHQLGLSGAKIEHNNKDSIHQLSYTDNEERVAVECGVADTLIFSENDYPGWVCYDNGKNIPIFSVTIQRYPPLFRSIALIRGKHLIAFRYKYAFHWF